MNETDILSHISSAYSARDMIEIGEKDGYKKVRYWGFSYGTLLAGVIATLYPDRLDRMVSDGKLTPTSTILRKMRVILTDDRKRRLYVMVRRRPSAFL
jgi:pimeloyl-ACP methyl ester carboxylesterase